MRRLTLPAATVMLLLTIVPTARAQTGAADAPTGADIQRLLELTGSAKVGPMMASLVAGQILQQMQQQHPEVPARAVEIVRGMLDEEFKTAFAADGPVMREVGAIWSKHFTADEIRGLIAFYETPLGRKVVDTLPAITQEASQAGVSWAQQHMPDISKKVQDRLRAEGLIK
jgi:hypothetical protein